MIQSGLTVSHVYTLLALGTLVLPISPYLCIAFFIFAGLISAISFNYASLTKDKLLVGLSLIAVSIWMIFRTGYKWGWGVHSLTQPMLYPVTLIDYVPFFMFFYFLSLRPFPLLETEIIAWSFAITIIPEFILAFYEKYIISQDLALFYPGEYTAIIKVYITQILRPRISAGFFNPNVFGCYCIIVFCLVLSLLLKEIRMFFSSLRISKHSTTYFIIKSMLKTSFLVLCTVLILVMIVWSQSRNAWLSAFLVMIAFILYTRAKWLIFITLVSLTSVCMSVLNFGWLTVVFRRMIPQEVWGRLSNEPLDDRSDIYRCAIDLIREKPMMGWGIGNFAPECETRLGYVVNHAHNIFLQLASEIGLPFTIVLSCIIAYVLFTSIRRVAQNYSLRDNTCDIVFGFNVAALSVVILNFFSVAILQSYRLIFLFWICLAIAYGGISCGRSSELQAISRNRNLPFDGQSPP